MDSEEETVTNSSTNSTEPYQNNQNLHKRLFLELFSLVALLSVIASVLLVFVILKYKKLRRNVTNKILLHLCILQFGYLLSTPLTYRLLADFNVHEFPPLVIVLCVLVEIETAAYFAILLFVILLLCDWYVKTYGGEDKYRKFGNVFKFFVVMIYVFFVCMTCATSQWCDHYGSMHLNVIASFFLYIAALVVVIIMNLIHIIKSRNRTISRNNTNVGLAVCNILIFFWCPAFMTLMLAFFGAGYPIVLIIFISMGFSSPVFISLYLFYYDNDFNVFLRRVFKCECNDYENEDFESSPVVFDGMNEVRLS